jgi:carbon starvation protein
VLVKMKRERYAWVTIVPTVWLLTCTLTAGWQKAFSDNPKVSFLAHASVFDNAVAQGKVLAPATSIEEMQRVILNDRIDAALAVLFMLVVVSVAVYGVVACLRALRDGRPTARESEYRALEPQSAV